MVESLWKRVLRVEPPSAEVLQEIRERRDRLRDDGNRRSTTLLESLQRDGASRDEIFEQQAWDALTVRLQAQANRCSMCWHDRRQRCICEAVGTVQLRLPVRVLVLMHHKEYFRASDDAKLLLMMLPPEHQRLFIFGRPGDLTELMAELDDDPEHALMLWPGEGALTVDQFLSALPPSSAWAQRHKASAAAPPPTTTADARIPRGAARQSADDDGTRLPVLRVVVLDAVYRHARTMFRHLAKLRAERPLQHVALHPKTLSVYSRAQHGYAQASAASVAQSSDPEALRICTVEAYALLLSELGEAASRTRPFVDAVVVNNEALRKSGIC